jgi:hypothetical protein
MATIRQKMPGVWEVDVFTGYEAAAPDADLANRARRQARHSADGRFVGGRPKECVACRSRRV